MHKRFSAHQFHNLEDAGFEPADYSALKFGSDEVARKFGFELAEKFFAKHADVIMANQCVVIPSPYNYIKNAATIMTEYFVQRLNELLVEANGNHVEASIIHRKVTYTSDYGFLSKEKRKGLIDNDSFYLNEHFIKDKVLIFIDDVRITGTHEEKLVEILEKGNIENDSFFLYFGEYYGNSPSIEAELNFSAISHPMDYLKMVTDNKHHVIVRTVKYLLGLDPEDCKSIIADLPKEFLHQIYYGSLGEGYYKMQNYVRNLTQIRTTFKGEQ